MTTRRPTLLRWTEESEAAQVRALATFECEPESAAARPVASAPQALSTWHRPAVLPWLLSWFGRSGSANKARRRLARRSMITPG
jgi:hypothetical protein